MIFCQPTGAPELRQSALLLRTQPISGLWQKMPSTDTKRL
jgi:hypothetical protein